MDLEFHSSYNLDLTKKSPHNKPSPAQKVASFRRYYHRRKKKREQRRSVNTSWFGLESSSESDVEITFASSSEDSPRRAVKLNETFIIRRNSDEKCVLPSISSDRAPRVLDRASLDRAIVSSLKPTSARTLNVVLREMRNVDRDRDRHLHGPKIQMILHKYNVQIIDLLEQLLGSFRVSTNYEEVYNYEELMEYLFNLKISSGSAPSYHHSVGHSEVPLGKDMSVSLPSHLNRMSGASSHSSNIDSNNLASPFDDRPSSFMDREEAQLLIELENIQKASPRFDIKTFQSALVERDHYGNGQISRQHVLRACELSRLNMVNPSLNNSLTLHKWLTACDPLGKGNIYLIHKLVDYLKRSVPC